MADRWNRLALEAYLRQAIDFRHFHRYDDLWRLKEDIVFQALESDLAAGLNKLVLQWHCNAAQLTEWDDKAEQFEFHKGKAEATYNDLGKHYMPWLPRWNQTEGQKLLQLYKAFRAEEQKPEFQPWHDAIQARMRVIARDMRLSTEQSDLARKKREVRDREQREIQRKRAQRG